MRRVRLGGGAAVTEVPRVRQAVAVGVRAARRGERHRERCPARRHVRRRLGDGRTPAGDVFDAVQSGVRVAVEVAGAVVEDVQGAVRAEGHVHHLGAVPGEGVDRLHGAVAAGLDPLDPAAPELAREEVAVELLRELHLRGGGGVVAVDGAAHRGLRAVAELRYRASVVGDPRRLGGRQVGQARVAGRGVLRRGAVELRAGGPGGEVVVRVGVVPARAVRPAEVARPGDAVELDLAGRSPRGVRGTGVRAVVAEVHDAGGPVHAHPERVAKAHGVDLGAGPGRARREEVAAGDRVRAVRVHLDAQHLAAQVVGVAGGTLRVVRGVAGGPLVDRGVAVGGEGVRVVARRQVQVALRVEVDVAADVAAGAARGGHVEDLLLAAGVQGAVGPQHEPGQAVDAVEAGEVRRRAVGRGVTGRRVELRGVVEVDVPVGGEARVHRDALQPLLVVAVDVQPAGDLRGAGGVGEPERAVPRGVQDGAVGQHRQGHRLTRLGHSLGEGDLLEVPGRRGRRGRCVAEFGRSGRGHRQEAAGDAHRGERQ